MDRKEITGIILAGGQSTRMGEDKGLLLLHQRPFVQHISDVLGNLVGRIIVVSANPKYQQYGDACFEDIYPNCGPMGGLFTGIAHSKTKHNFVLSCDIPLISKSLLQSLWNAHNPQTEITVAQAGSQIMPLVGLYQQCCKAFFLEKIKAKKFRLIDAILERHCQTYQLTEEHLDSVRNINSKADYQSLLS